KYYVYKSCNNILVIDEFEPPHHQGSNHGDTRIIRHAYGEGEEYVSFALKAQQLWHELEEASGKQLFLQTGVLNMGHEMTKFTQNIIASSKTYSLPLEVLH